MSPRQGNRHWLSALCRALETHIPDFFAVKDTAYIKIRVFLCETGTGWTLVLSQNFPQVQFGLKLQIYY